MLLAILTAAASHVNDLRRLLVNNKNLFLQSNLPDEQENVTATWKDSIVRITGSLVAVVERLDDEFTKILQQSDSHSTDYPIKLGDVITLVDIWSDAWFHEQYPAKRSVFVYEYDICPLFVLIPDVN
jgi:hypothetical protein